MLTSSITRRLLRAAGMLAALSLGVLEAQPRPAPPSPAVFQAPQSNDRGARLFAESIRPLFAARCLPCHDAETKKGGLDVTSREALLRGGEQGPGILPGNARASLLYRVLTREAPPYMPPNAPKLPDDAIAHLSE